MKNYKKYLKGFTLVELIIVITILTILGTISFISFQDYFSDARDTNRMTTLKTIENGLQLYKMKTRKYPMPEDYTTITASGIEISYQGYFGEEASKNIGMGKIPLDPMDNERYIYSVTDSKKEYQLLGFMENEENQVAYNSIINKSYADYSERYPQTFGSVLGIILNEDNSLPITNINVQSATLNYKIIFGGNDSIVSSGNSLFSNIYNRRSDFVFNKEIAKLDDSLVGYWDMETTIQSGGVILLKDFSKYSNHGICFNGGISGSCGTYGFGPQIIEGNGTSGKGMYFDGVDDWIRVPFTNTYSFSGQITVIAKIKLAKACTIPFDGDPCIDTIVWKGGSHNPGFWLAANYGGEKYLTEINGNAGGIYVTSNNKNRTDIWSNVYFIKNNDINKYIINGIIDKNVTMSYNLLNNTNNLSIGSAFDTNNRVFDGSIDEIRIYNRALSDLEVKEFYNVTK